MATPHGHRCSLWIGLFAAIGLLGAQLVTPPAFAMPSDPPAEAKTEEGKTTDGQQPDKGNPVKSGDKLNQCPTGQVFDDSCKACAESCETGKVWDCSKKQCQAKSSLKPSDDALYSRAHALVKEQRYADALALLSTIERRDDPKVLNYIGYTTRKLGDIQKGIGFYMRALAIDPNYTKAREYLGEGYLEQGDLTRAKEQLGEIARRCGTACEEYEALAQAIAMHITGQKLNKTW